YSELGVGSTFRIYLPAVAAVEEPAPAPAPAPLARGRGETVLLAEDELPVRVFIRRVLTANGYRVIECADGLDALRTASAHDGALDLLLTDVVMPRMQGKQLALELSGLRPGLRVVYMSGYTEHALVENGMVHAAVGYLQKPFSQETLLQKVREILDGPAPAAG
ncbi:MAG: response regulator, partial [Myxococcales bacterium]